MHAPSSAYPPPCVCGKVSVPVAPGDAIVIGGRVVHGSHPAVEGERVAFSPLYEWELV